MKKDRYVIEDVISAAEEFLAVLVLLQDQENTQLTSNTLYYMSEKLYLAREQLEELLT